MTDDRKTTTLGDLIGWRKEGSVGRPKATGQSETDPSEIVHEPPAEIVKAEPQKATNIPVVLGTAQQLTKDLREINQKDDPSVGEVLSAFTRAFASYQKAPDAEKQAIGNELSQALGPAAKTLGIQSKFDEIVTVGSVIVTYRPNILNMKAEQKEKIRNVFTAILKANPDADLKVLEDSIGVRIINVQRPAPPPQNPKGFSFNG